MSSVSSSTDVVPFSGSTGASNTDAARSRSQHRESSSRSNHGSGNSVGKGTELSSQHGGGDRAGGSSASSARRGLRRGGVKKNKKKQKEFHTLEKPQYPHPARGRTVFTSIATLQSDWKKLPIDLLADCILFLDCDRSWVFHGIEGELPYAFYKTGFDAR